MQKGRNRARGEGQPQSKAKIYQTPLEAAEKYTTYLQQIIIMCQQIYICARGDCSCAWVYLRVCVFAFCHLPFGIFHLPASLASAVYGYQWTLNCSHEICNCNCEHTPKTMQVCVSCHKQQSPDTFIGKFQTRQRHSTSKTRAQYNKTRPRWPRLICGLSEPVCVCECVCVSREV